MVMILFLVPPQIPRMTDPASIPTDHTVSTRAAPSVLTAKYSMLISG